MRDMKTIIAMPALDVMPTQTTWSLLNLKRDCPSRFSFIVRASCHDARNMLAREAIESGADRVLWIDSDMVFDEDLMIRLGEDLDDGWDMVCGIYFKRELPVTPVIYSDINAEERRTRVYTDYPKDALFAINGCGFGAVMTTVKLLDDVRMSWGGAMFDPLPGLSEDLSFCYRAGKLGARIACDSRIHVGHVGQIVYGEKMYKHPGG